MVNNTVITLCVDRWLLDLLWWSFHNVYKCQATLETNKTLYVNHIAIIGKKKKTSILPSNPGQMTRTQAEKQELAMPVRRKVSRLVWLWQRACFIESWKLRSPPLFQNNLGGSMWDSTSLPLQECSPCFRELCVSHTTCPALRSYLLAVTIFSPRCLQV